MPDNAILGCAYYRMVESINLTKIKISHNHVYVYGGPGTRNVDGSGTRHAWTGSHTWHQRGIYCFDSYDQGGFVTVEKDFRGRLHSAILV